MYTDTSSYIIKRYTLKTKSMCIPTLCIFKITTALIIQLILCFFYINFIDQFFYIKTITFIYINVIYTHI